MVTLVPVVVINHVVCLVSVIDYTVLTYRAMLYLRIRITQPVISMPKSEYFFSTQSLKMTLLLQSTIISNAKCTVRAWGSVAVKALLC